PCSQSSRVYSSLISSGSPKNCVSTDSATFLVFRRDPCGIQVQFIMFIPLCSKQAKLLLVMSRFQLHDPLCTNTYERAADDCECDKSEKRDESNKHANPVFCVFANLHCEHPLRQTAAAPDQAQATAKFLKSACTFWLNRSRHPDSVQPRYRAPYLRRGSKSP